MERLGHNELHYARVLFDGPLLHLVGESVIAGHTAGTAWVDNRLTPQLLVMQAERSIFISGHPSDLMTRDEIGGLLADHLAGWGGTFKLVYTPNDDRWEDIAVFSGPQETDLQRRIYTSLDAPVKDRSGVILRDATLRQIDGALLQSDLRFIGDLKNEIAGGWRSEAAFLNDGFGYAIVGNSAVLCWCTAEYRSPEMCGIGIETVREYRRRGYATVAAAAFVGHATSLGIAVYWDCFRDNETSLRLAEKVGFSAPHGYVASIGSLGGQSQTVSGD